MTYIWIMPIVLFFSVPAWGMEPSATESPSSNQSTTPSSQETPNLRVEDLPKPVQDMLAEIQRLSRKVEPEIEKFGSRFREEVDQAVKKLREATKTDKSRPDTK